MLTAPKNPSADALLTLAQVAEHLGVSRRTAYSYAAAGFFPTVRLSPRATRVRASDLQRFIESRRKGGAR